MAPIPGIHLRFTFPPFDQTAIDYARPFTTVQGRGVHRQKDGCVYSLGYQLVGSIWKWHLV